MPLLTQEELAGMTPLFCGRLGQSLAAELIHCLKIDKLNDMYDKCHDYVGPDFAAEVIRNVGLDLMVGFSEGYQGALEDFLPDGPFITLSNHPCGHLDGVALVDVIGHLRPDYKVMVNGLLSRVENLNANFICVTPKGNVSTSPTAVSIGGIKNALGHLRDGCALGLFPSGAVSDLSLKEGCVRDRPWQESVIRLIRKARVPVVPIRFFDGNSALYYMLGLLDWRIRLLRLPAEVSNKVGKPFRMGFGPVVTVDVQDEYGADILGFGTFLRSCVYDMKMPELFHPIL